MANAENEDTKRRKADEEEEQNADRISNLPVIVLSHILSFLPIKTAVSTSLLSPKWRHIWQQHLSVLDFSDDFFQPNDDRLELFRTLAVFVNCVFIFRTRCEIRKMRLSCTKSLVNHKFSLKGAVYFDLKRAKAIHLPSLKKLQLDIGGYVEVSAMNALLSGCRNLETLDLCFSAEDYGGILRVPPALKWLKIIINNSDAGASLEIDVPVLEYLCIANITVTDASNLQNVVEASLDVLPSSAASAFPLFKLLGALAGIKHLVLSRSTTKVLAVKKIDSSILPNNLSEDFMEIVSNLSRLHHPNVTELAGYCLLLLIEDLDIAFLSKY
ncbi:hypothetical protein TSUD_355720 [Trifolium subterraneum]|uniref:F-box domain-containing protein n=1 Tax=Trifolium subterraneum TaxID=3900 RepID=A0A2Z6M3K5_TRISU|nr:hypothetical protein TSUD_355720 [Trifolium subterraneum]